MLVVSLSGGSGSGKTTLAKQIVSKFPAGLINLLPIDAYYKDHSHLSAAEKTAHNFDHPDSIDFELLIEHLRKLKMSIPIEMPIYSFITCSRENSNIKVQPSEILIIEGLMALTNEQLRAETDVKIYLDVAEANRFERIIERDITERGRSREMSMERFYKMVQPMHESFIEPYKFSADVIIDGNNPNITAISTSIVQIIGKYMYHANCQSLD